MKYTLALLIDSTFSLAIALSEIQQGTQGSDKGMQLLVTSVFRTPRWPHLSPYQEKMKNKKKLYTGRIRFIPTVCTIGPIHYLLRKSHLQKKTNQNHLPSLVFHDFYRLSKNSDMIGGKA